MYLPAMTDEELLRYADQAATTELEEELVNRFEGKLDEITNLAEENDNLRDTIEELREELAAA